MNSLTLGAAERREWSVGWKIPLIAAIGMGMSASPNLTLGALMTAIQDDTGWSRLQISSGAAIMSVIIVTLAPLMGHAVDRFGSRRIALPGLVMFCLALASLAIAGASKWTWWAGWTFLAVAALFIKSTVWTAAVISRFDQSRGLAIAVTLSGTGLASFCLPFILTLLQQSFGWRGAYIGLAAIFALLSLPAWFFFFDASDQRRRDKAEAITIDRSKLPGLTPREIFRSRRFAQMALACLLVGIAISSLTVHFIPILRGKGASPLTAAGIASVIGLATIVGRLVTGWLLDRFNGPLIGLIALALPAVGCALLLADAGLSFAFVVAVLIGFSAGAEFDVIAYLAARYFGVRHYGLVFGTVVGLLSCGAGLGPMFGAQMFDHFGDYSNLLLIVGTTFALSGVLIGTLGAYPTLAAPEPSP
ncbi:MFS transporter [Rhizorhabdus dicambivorans]|uniref:MFS transporter n=1 Tax=Rhizorhabdus dicambivorans TaxID=1850238 RepID=A0A2A4FXV3_9SPHN|nr:MFS transporter [Rhizorhabdus dicambivorans]ATE64200.1 MFS transporter [Rhizorhabdus dicambivorans]PCE42528.1 MFS transporter [Rhizorhabdus dicambivorans]